MDEESNSIEETQLESEQTDQSNEVATLSAQKAHWREKAQKVQAELEALKAKLPVETKKEEPDELQTVKAGLSQLQLAEKKRQFGYEHGLSPDETDAVFRLNPSPTKETLEDAFVKGGIEAIRAKRKLDNNIPGSTSNSISFAADKNLEEMKPEEKQAAFEKFMAAKYRK